MTEGELFPPDDSFGAGYISNEASFPQPIENVENDGTANRGKQPAMKCKRAHRGFGQHGRNGVHWVGAKMRRQRDGLAGPLNGAGADFGDFHWMIIE